MTMAKKSVAKTVETLKHGEATPRIFHG